MMPSNAHRLFQIIIQIATFDLAPVESIIEGAEEKLGIENDGFILSDNFAAFDLDSTDLIRNLQILFLFMLLLLGLPVLLLVIQTLLCWSEQATKCIDAVRNKIYWSIYIRFLLESFLELSIVSLLRMKNLVFDSSSAIFQSVMSLTLLTILAVFMIGSTVFVLKNFARLSDPDLR